MSVEVQRFVWELSKAKGASLLTLLCLSSYVSHEKWIRGDAPLAWPSQNTIARRCNCSRSTVERALEDLKNLGEIRDTGERRLRGTIVWEITLPDLTEDGSSPPTGPTTGQEDGGPDPSCSDLTHPAIDLTQDGSSPASTLKDKREVGSYESVIQEGSSGSALDSSSSDLEEGTAKERNRRAAEAQEMREEIETLEFQLALAPEGSPQHSRTLAGIELGKRELASLEGEAA